MIKQAEASEFCNRHNVGYVKNLHNVFSFFIVVKIFIQSIKGITVKKVLNP
jgi:hypothetical protein